MLFSVTHYHEEPLLRLVKINNGLTPLNFQGEYSFSSPKWTQEQREKLGYNFNDPNTTWMTLEEFQKNFDQVVTFKSYPNYYYNSCEIKPLKSPQNSLIKIVLHQDSHSFLTIFQRDSRKMPLDYKFSYFRMTLVKINEKSLSFELSLFSQKRNLEIERLLSRGSYLLLIEPLWNQQPFEFTLGSYSSSMLWMEKVVNVSEEDYN